MSSIGTGYDLSVSTYSPDGRLFQVSLFHDHIVRLDQTLIITGEGRVRQQSRRCCWVSPNSTHSRIQLISFRVAIGLRCSDGVILGVERLLHSKLLVACSNRRIASVEEHIGMASAGLLADGKHLAGQAMDEAYNFRDTYNAPISVRVSFSPWRLVL